MSKLRIVLFFAGYVLIFVALALFGYYVGGKFAFNRVTPIASQSFATDTTFYDLPRIGVSLSGSQGVEGRSAPHVRMDIALEIAKKDADVISGFQPRMIEKITTYVARLRPEEITRRDTLPWLRLELLHQVNSVGSPAPVDNLFFRQFVVM